MSKNNTNSKNNDKKVDDKVVQSTDKAEGSDGASQPTDKVEGSNGTSQSTDKAEGSDGASQPTDKVEGSNEDSQSTDNVDKEDKASATNKKPKKVKMLCDYWSTYGVFKANQTVEFAGNVAARFIKDGIAIEAKD